MIDRNRGLEAEGAGQVSTRVAAIVGAVLYQCAVDRRIISGLDRAERLVDQAPP